jgi:hypothetical protein
LAWRTRAPPSPEPVPRTVTRRDCGPRASAVPGKSDGGSVNGHAPPAAVPQFACDVCNNVFTAAISPRTLEAPDAASSLSSSAGELRDHVWELRLRPEWLRVTGSSSISLPEEGVIAVCVCDTYTATYTHCVIHTHARAHTHTRTNPPGRSVARTRGSRGGGCRGARGCGAHAFAPYVEQHLYLKPRTSVKLLSSFSSSSAPSRLGGCAHKPAAGPTGRKSLSSAGSFGQR